MKKKKKEKVTIHDIALKLNITASTVSRALNNSPRISEGTKRAVQDAARQLNYQPNHLAAALRIGKSKIIGIIVPSADRMFFASVVRGIEEIANKINYKVIICQSYDDYEKEVQTIDALLCARVDGIIASIGKTTKDFGHFKHVSEKGIPLVLFDRTTDKLNINEVVIDDYMGAYSAVTHLIQQGCKRIAHFTSPTHLNLFKNRLLGYQEALKDNGLAFDEQLVVESNLQLEDGRASMEKLLQLKEIPDAVFSASDFGAIGAMQVLKERNIQVPQQVALVGFSNEPFTIFTDPPISTVDQLSQTMGKVTAELFFKQLLSPTTLTVPKRTMLKPKLIIRQSSLRKKPLSPVMPDLAIEKVCTAKDKS